MPDEDRVFDVTKPKNVSPPATSKPVIVGHHPMMSDPMVKEADKPGEEPMHIKVMDDSHEPRSDDHSSPLDNSPAPPEAATIFSEPNTEEHQKTSVKEPAAPETSKIPAEPTVDKPSDAADAPAIFPEVAGPGLIEPAAESKTEPDPLPDPAPTEYHPAPHIEGLHFNENNYKYSWWKPAVLVLLLLLIGIYLVIDSGLINTGINLPFHVFKQKQPASSSATAKPPPAKAPAAAVPSVPAGFKEYQLYGTNLTFDAPLTWGAPTSTADPGYSKRGTGQQSDGTHAYLVNFASNKDIQLAVTSGKYLPAVRGTQYYDYLQWCTGTNDGKFYQSTLHFTSTAGIDTPSTVVCDQGPLANATKLDANTIMQTKATDSAGKVIGDVYTKNLSDPNLNLVVIRAKDLTMTNGDNIKRLLATVRFSASQ